MDQSSPRHATASGGEGRGLTLKERQRHEREELILQTAEEVLLEHGYHETSLDEIAARVGISKGTIYLHFASKDDLVVALAERGMRTFLRTLDTTLAGPGSPRAKLQAVLDKVVGSLGGREFHLLTNMMQSPELMGRFAERRKYLYRQWEEPRQRLSALFEDGKAEGDFDPAIPTPVLLSLFTSLLSPHSYRRLVVNEGMAPEEVARYLGMFFFRGTARPDASAE